MRYDEDKNSSEGESIEQDASAELTCTVCLKQRWSTSLDPSRQHCRDYCLHATPTTTVHDDAPTMERAPQMTTPLSCMLPLEVAATPVIHKKPKQRGEHLATTNHLHHYNTAKKRLQWGTN